MTLQQKVRGILALDAGLLLLLVAENFRYAGQLSLATLLMMLAGLTLIKGLTDLLPQQGS